MKKSLLKITILALVGLALSSCEKADDTDPTISVVNTVTVDGSTYSLVAGVTKDYGGNTNDGYNFDLSLLSSGYTTTNWTSTGSFSGTGEKLYLELWSSSASSLVAGTYSYNSSNGTNTFSNANFSLANGTTYTIRAGTITVAVSGSTYTITINLQDTNSKSVTGSFTGSLPSYNVPD